LHNSDPNRDGKAEAKWSREEAGGQSPCSYVKQGTTVETAQYRSFYEAYLDGCTIVCGALIGFWPPAAQLLREAGASLGFPMTGNLYATPRQAQGFTWHTDCMEVWLCHLIGRKQWQVIVMDIML